MVRLLSYLTFALFLLITSLSCDSSEPLVNSGANLTLALEDSSSTELWLRLTSSNIPLPISISLNQTDSQNNSVARTISLCCNDTLLYIDSLLPKQTYKFKAEATNYQLQASNELTAATMDTTSHNFTWQSWEFGEHSTSVLYDVAIIDENSIWAVGEIYMNDSLGNPDPNAYNAAHWDGSQWELKRIKTNACGGVEFPPIVAIFSFSADDLLLAHIDGSITHYDGTEFINDCSLITQLNGSANKIWGISKNDFYVVSSNGFIAHYSGPSGWQKIESGTDLDIYDIWGEYNSKASENEILIVAAEQYRGPRRKILKLLNSVIEELSTENIPDGSLNGIWFKSGRKYFVVGNGIYTKQAVENSNEWIALHPDLTPYYIYAIRGSSFNNIFLCGSFGESLHFNGASWKTFRSTSGFYDVEFLNTDIKGNIIVAVGYGNSKAFITIGKN
ncbi:MAG: glucosyl transferase [Ignavibacteriales bacterium]|nr:glucosyl transferase [Ignavibacteriales bacterium]